MISFVMLFVVLAVVIGIVAGVAILPGLIGQRQQMSASLPSREQLEDLQRLQIEVGEMQSEIARLTERLDFTERLLEGRQEQKRLPDPEQD